MLEILIGIAGVFILLVIFYFVGWIEEKSSNHIPQSTGNRIATGLISCSILFAVLFLFYAFGLALLTVF